MKHRLVIYTLIGVALLAGCSRGPTPEDLFQERMLFEARYAKGTLQAAENAMLEYLDALCKHRNDNVRGLDYNYLFGLVYGRLFVLNDALGDQTEADEYYAKSLHWIEIDKRESGAEPMSFTREMLKARIMYLDARLEPQWVGDVSGVVHEPLGLSSDHRIVVSPN
jgi:hypothetical protein